jgi:ubiquinone/menaquinone biosynthesis C-methylase UbiE
MSNTYWSTYVQYSEELYRSRALRFHDGNKSLWLTALGAEDGMRILEVGGGGGIFCHRLKSYLPNTRVTGLDLDTGHIDYAKAKSAELGLDCGFVAGDALSLPFEDNTFDLCFSHTVIDFCEPSGFVAEQRRVLKPGGVMVILNVIGSVQGINGMWAPAEGSGERALFDRLWAAADKNKLSDIKKYPIPPESYPKLLEKAGFRDITMRVFAVMAYAPDSGDVDDAAAIEQINENRLSALSSIKKARVLAPDALTETEFGELTQLINQRYDKRIDQYKRGEKLWDMSTSTVLAVSGRK